MIEVTAEMRRFLSSAWKGDITRDEAVKGIIELHEQSKPKHDPVAYKVCNPAGCVLVESRKSAEKLSSEYGNGRYQPLYTTQPTLEPLSDDFLMNLAEECTANFFNGVHQNATIHFARAVEQSHGIGLNND